MIRSRAIPRSRGAALAVALATAALVAGCSAAAQPSPSTQPSLSTQPGSATPAASPTNGRPPDLPGRTPPVVRVDPSASPIVGEVPPAIMAAVRADLARSTSAASGAVAEVVRAEAVQWPDGSLGCRVPGQLYLQVITPGYWIVLSVDNTEHDYRVTQAGAIRRCDQPLKPNPGG